jgi:hypothetical protein
MNLLKVSIVMTISKGANPWEGFSLVLVKLYFLI